MMAGNLERGFAIVELLAKQGGSMQLATIADTLDIPRSGTHRLLAELGEEGFVRQDERGEYVLSLKLVSLALTWLSTGGVLDIAQPVLDKLAGASGELARLGVIEDDHIIFVGKAQGAKSGLRYDPDMGSQPPLHCTASGAAWLSTMSDEEALELVSRQGGIGKAGQKGPKAPKTIQQFLKDLDDTRKREYGIAIDTYETGMAAMAVAVRHPVSGAVVGVVTLAGPTSRLSIERIRELSSALRDAGADMSAAVLSSPYFKRSLQVAPINTAVQPATPKRRGRPKSS
jgi:IclR family transcriptional regulator, negative regulator of allantoin and glyoxylate utilization operons